MAIDEESIANAKMSAQLKCKKGKYRQLFREFAENSSAGGIDKVFSSKSLLTRCIWIVLCIACYGTMVFLCYRLIKQFSDKPTTTFVDVTFERDMSFPSVTICNLNKFRRSTLRENLPGVNRILKIYRRLAAKLGKTGDSWGDNDKLRRIYIESVFAKSGIKNPNLIDTGSITRRGLLKTRMLEASAWYSDEKLRKSGHQFQDLVVDCRWMGVKCEEGYFSKYWKHLWNWKYGNCYAFNFGLDSNGTTIPPLRTTKAGPTYGLQLDLFLEQHEYIPELSDEAGVKVVIVNQKQHPFPSHEGWTIAPGSAASIALRTEVIERLDPFRNKSCVDDSVMEDNIYGREGSQFYTVQSCLDTCLARQQQSECNCTDPRYPTQRNKCLSLKEKVCVSKVDIKHKNDAYDCLKTCPQNCRSVSYRATMSSSQISFQFQDVIRAALNNSARFRKYVKTGQDFKKDFLRLKIYFEELNLVRIHQQLTYSPSNLLADIGGQLGLWVGLSVITFAEFGGLLLSLIKLIFSKD